MEYRSPAAGTYAPQASAPPRYAPAEARPPDQQTPQQRYQGEPDQRYGLDLAHYANPPRAPAEGLTGNGGYQPQRGAPAAPTLPYPNQAPARSPYPDRAATGYPQQQPQQPPQQQPQWDNQLSAGNGYAAPKAANRSDAPPMGRDRPGEPEYGSDLQAHAGDEDYDDDMIEDEDDEPRRGRRGMLVVAALVGAIGIGGGLAYAYKTLGSSASGGKPPLLMADTDPSRTKPAIPGGKEFANADKKIFTRLGDDTVQGQQVASAGETNPAGPKLVQTIPIGPTALSQSAPGAARGVSTIAGPGMTVDNGPPVAPPGGARPLPAVVPQQQAPVVSPPAAPPARVAAVVPPRAPVQKAVPPAIANVVETDANAAPVQPAPVAKKVAAARTKAPDAFSPGTTGAQPAPSAAPVTASAGTSGFVAVLSSQKSRMDALKVYADLQQKYGDVLSDKPADVQESDQTSRGKGVVYRAVVGPPGSREAAESLCTQLKSAGHKDCWVNAY